MSVLWPTLVKRKIPSIPHTTYLFPSSDALLYYDEGSEALLWDTSGASPVSPGLEDNTSNNAGDVWTSTSPLVYVQDPPSPANATGNYRLRITTYTIAQGWANGNAWAKKESTVHIGTSSAYINEISYTDPDENNWPGKLVHFYKDGDESFYASQTSRVDVLETGTDNEEGEYMFLKVDAYSDIAPALGGTVRTQGNIISIYNDAEYSNGDDGWDGVQAETTASYKDSNSTNLETSTQARAFSGDTEFGISRSFFTFDTTPIAGADRSVSSAVFQITGFGYNESDCILQTSTHEVAEGVISSNSFRAYADVVSSAIDWQLWDGGVPYRHLVTLNTTGTNYMQTQITAGDQAKFCMREYDHDYLDVAPSGDARYRNGCAYSEMPPAGIYVLSPCLEVTYNKIPDWTSKIAEANWVDWSGTWNGTGWDSDGDTLGLDVTGSWIDNERWAAVRLIFTGVDSLSFYMEDNDDIMVDGDEIISGEVFTIPWRADASDTDYDFYYWYFISDGDSFTVSSIDFLER